MRIAIIVPAVGHRASGGYPRSWRLEPLAAARLAALCPAEAEVRIFDDRCCRLAGDIAADLALLSADTYSARRAYQIASDLRRRRIPVVMGGIHASLRPDETARFADAVVVGQAEGALPQALDDWRAGRLQDRYNAPPGPPAASPPRREAYSQRYPSALMVETARGCRHACNFCSVAQVTGSTWFPRPLGGVVEEIRRHLPFHRTVALVDDNLAADHGHLRAVINALRPLHIRWSCQIAWQVAEDTSLLAAMHESGCTGVLIGFESLASATLGGLSKGFNPDRRRAEAAVTAFHRHGLTVYGTFILGADGEDPDADSELADFVLRSGMFLASFNPLTPFPGTAAHARLLATGRLPRDDWWLDPQGRCGAVVFTPQRCTPAELAERCRRLRTAILGWRGLLGRGLRRHHLCNPVIATAFWLLNRTAAGDIRRREGLPLGDLAWTGNWSSI